MQHPVKGIDHCFALVDDLDSAAAQYRALGFTVSPRGLHSASKGTANHTIMFPDDYFELLGVLVPTAANAARRATLQTMKQGLHAIACRIASAPDAAAALGAMGIATQGLGSFSRPVDLSDGSTGVAAFSTVAFTPDDTPRGIVFMCAHDTPETVWVPDLLSHENTAAGLGAVVALSDDPATDAAGFARLWADGSVTAQDGTYTVHTGVRSAPLVLADADHLGAYYAGIDLSGTTRGAFTALRIKVHDLSAVAACLTRAEITATATPAGLAISPEHAAGVLMEFIPT
ncbi:VOC family protein [Roseobacter sp.]|uniref:VOC family protein n=1 Tax=Roseobacter sp. TaxID=1907202 RepID=UPI00329990F6